MKYLSKIIIGCIGVCLGFVLCNFRADHGAQIPDTVRASFERSYPRCAIRYVTTPHVVSGDQTLMVYRINFRNGDIPVSVDFLPNGVMFGGEPD
jgi:hypothetical protein